MLHQLRRNRSYVTDKWHLNEMVVTIKKQQYYLWRAVDSEGNVLDVLLQRQRDTKAASALCYAKHSCLDSDDSHALDSTPFLNIVEHTTGRAPYCRQLSHRLLVNSSQWS